ncbi:MAG: Phosphate propanoyltransferase [Candidatus Giovannonibacteria bacterium GW2011_GWA2_53_7]|uniref:Phosphate propanoyltransferase n=1 Tax=Candidatus Giovannonibacteria bacterium GW2011_GWA2_53_7 TaxID=1618650 RepID=A0A0G2A725_9BACT|nr:MAG: Phosphate propanoyltransferase [Candidatus Giovannonibacteria bacterium GW2011_GWA2_53_7]
MFKIPVVIQHRHVHVSPEDQAALFGEGTTLTPVRSLEHREQVVYRETVDLVGKAGRLERVRILGPARAQTQVEISASEAFALGIDAPVRVSGDLKRSGNGELVGPHGKVKVRSRVIIPARHIHCSASDAKKLGMKHEQLVSVKTADGSTIEHITLRVHPTFRPAFHLTADEAAEYWLHTGDHVTFA